MRGLNPRCAASEDMFAPDAEGNVPETRSWPDAGCAKRSEDRTLNARNGIVGPLSEWETLEDESVSKIISTPFVKAGCIAVRVEEE